MDADQFVKIQSPFWEEHPRFPKVIAAFFATLIGLESGLLGLTLAKPIMAQSQSAFLHFTIFAGFAVCAMASAFTVALFSLGLRVQRIGLFVGGWFWVGFTAVLSGVTSTLLLFGKAGPHGFVLEGISGPLTDGFVTAQLHPLWWPFAFLAGMAAPTILFMLLFPLPLRTQIQAFLLNRTRRQNA
ncbi:MAG: hypothetical protein AAF903_11645 [Pseudomonadota bacterium]